MKQFKPAQIIMLNSKYESNILKLENSLLFNNIITKYDLKSLDRNECFQHLYIISDDEIKKSDWYYDKIHNIINQCVDDEDAKDINFRIVTEKTHFKIIATTDSSLKIPTISIPKELGYNYSLPQPSQQFIEKYIKSYNKGEVITDVLVEYEKIRDEKYWNPIEGNLQRFNILIPKVNPKDNTITIKKIKNSWNREEVITLLESVYALGHYSVNNNHQEEDHTTIINNFIKENL